MQALEYWKTVTNDKAGFLDRVIALLAEAGVRYCVIGGRDRHFPLARAGVRA